MMKEYTVSVEFRNKTWFDDAHMGQTLAFERELNVVHTVIDGPQGFHNSVPPVWESTHIDFALVRLHGRNHETWNIKGATVASERFDYDYPDTELEDIAARVERLAPETFTTHVVMNNNNEDQGQRNAATLMRALERRRQAKVPKLVAAPGAATPHRLIPPLVTPLSLTTPALYYVAIAFAPYGQRICHEKISML
jgi:uncharacterized protein YecE (DUF72 family)